MSDLPATSITLIKSIAGNEESARWYDFYRDYVPGLKSFLEAKFPTVEADDVVQETFRALVKCLPDYVYMPEKTGHFRNYLLGIVNHKALDVVRSRAREQKKRAGIQDASESEPTPRPVEDDEERAWQTALLEAALAQLLADARIKERDREVFRRVAVAHEKPEDVAAAFGLTRGHVDVLKKRMLEKLQARAAAMLRARDFA